MAEVVDRYSSGKFSNAKCSYYDGDRQRGWRHSVCVGDYKYHRDTTFRFRLLSTPRSCKRIQATLTVPGLGITKKALFVWNHHHSVDSCKH